MPVVNRLPLSYFFTDQIPKQVKIRLKSYNLAEANDYLIRHIFRTKPHLTKHEMCDELGISLQYLTKKMEELKLHFRKPHANPSEKERFMKRFNNAKWNCNIYFRKSSLDTVEKYLKIWIKEQEFKNYEYLIMLDPDQVKGSVIVYLPMPT